MVIMAMYWTAADAFIRVRTPKIRTHDAALEQRTMIFTEPEAKM